MAKAWEGIIVLLGHLGDGCEFSSGFIMFYIQSKALFSIRRAKVGSLKLRFHTFFKHLVNSCSFSRKLWQPWQPWVRSLQDAADLQDKLDQLVAAERCGPLIQGRHTKLQAAVNHWDIPSGHPIGTLHLTCSPKNHENKPQREWRAP